MKKRDSILDRQLSRFEQNFSSFNFSFKLGPLFLVKQVRHSVNLIQKRFVSIPFQRYIIDEVLVKDGYLLAFS